MRPKQGEGGRAKAKPAPASGGTQCLSHRLDGRGGRVQPKLCAMSEASAPSTTTAARESVRAMFSPLYRELRRLAHARLSGGRPTLLDTSALVHEVFLRMEHDSGPNLADRNQFLAYAATTMRSVVIDFMRRRNAERRGGGLEKVTLDARLEALAESDGEVLAVHEALRTLEVVDPRLVRVVEMRYFAGLTDVEIGVALGLTDRTVRRDWDRARLLLSHILGR
jgi:RNA polymerase sigma factor (TIGR02999 family)